MLVASYTFCYIECILLICFHSTGQIPCILPIRKVIQFWQIWLWAVEKDWFCFHAMEGRYFLWFCNAYFHMFILVSKTYRAKVSKLIRLAWCATPAIGYLRIYSAAQIDISVPLTGWVNTDQVRTRNLEVPIKTLYLLSGWPVYLLWLFICISHVTSKQGIVILSWTTAKNHEYPLLYFLGTLPYPWSYNNRHTWCILCWILLYLFSKINSNHRGLLLPSQFWMVCMPSLKQFLVLLLHC